MRWLGPIVVGLVLLFLLGPFVVIAAAALSAGETLVFPPNGLSLRWFVSVVAAEQFRESFMLSVELAVVGTGLALVLGVPTAYAITRYELPGRDSIRAFMSTPVIVPGIIASLALLRYAVIPLGLTIPAALLIAHTALVLPYAIRVVTASLDNLHTGIEEAAVVLGATRTVTFFRVVLPNIRNGVLAAFILGFVTSFNNVPVSLFLSGPGQTTLPIEMLSSMELVYDPSIAALSTLLAIMSVLLVGLAERALGLSRYV